MPHFARNNGNLKHFITIKTWTKGSKFLIKLRKLLKLPDFYHFCWSKEHRIYKRSTVKYIKILYVEQPAPVSSNVGSVCAGATRVLCASLQHGGGEEKCSVNSSVLYWAGHTDWLWIGPVRCMRKSKHSNSCPSRTLQLKILAFWIWCRLFFFMSHTYFLCLYLVFLSLDKYAFLLIQYLLRIFKCSVLLSQNFVNVIFTLSKSLILILVLKYLWHLFWSLCLYSHL